MTHARYGMGLLVVVLALAPALRSQVPGGATPAQQELARICNPRRLDVPAAPELGIDHPSNVFAAAMQRIQAGDALTVVDSLGTVLSAALPTTSPLRAPFLRQFAALRADLLALDPAALILRDSALVRGVALDPRFRAVDEEGSFRFFAGTADSVLVRVDTPEGERRAACGVADVLVRLVTRTNLPALQAALRTLEENERAWTRWETEGWSLYPWESLANALPGIRKCSQTSLGPPRCTLALLHPAVGVVLAGPTGSGASYRDWRSSQEVVWDVIGVRTYDRRGRSRWGVAVIALIPAELPASVGAAVSFGRLIQVGWVPTRGAGAAGTRFALSLDAFQYLSSIPSWLAERQQRVKDLLADGRAKAGFARPER